MNTSAVGKLPPAERLLYWIREREAIRIRKEAGEPPPWTDDEILRTYRFTNVRRMDDKVSQWLLANWYEPYKGHPNTLYAAALARSFNLPTTLHEVTEYVYCDGPPGWRRIKDKIKMARGSGRNVFNAAYVVSTNGVKADKVEYVVDRVCKPLADRPPLLDTGSMERSVGVLAGYNGLKSFMAGQIVADLRWAMTGLWRDRNRWAPQGPGSTRGLARLLGLDPATPMRPVVFRRRFNDVLERGFNRLPWEVRGRMEAMDCQNCLCEWDKYERTLWDEGRPKQLYRKA